MKINDNLFLSWKTISWTAIFSGVITGFGINFLLNLTALALGISIFTITQEKTVFSILGFLAFSFISILTMFATGWVAGKLSPPIFLHRIWGALIGFIAWSMLLMITIIILMNMVQFVSFHSNFTSQPNLTGIRITNDAPMMTEAKIGKDTKSPLNLNIEKTTKIITLNANATLILFLLGALSSCIGGYIGYGHNKKKPSFLVHKME